MLELLGLPARAGVGFVTGAPVANFIGLAAARHAVLARAGWDVERDGLRRAADQRAGRRGGARHDLPGAADARPRRRAASARRHRRAGPDGPDALARALAAGHGPTIVCAQAGNVNTGAFDPLDAIAELTREHGAWLHVDGAFGLWAAPRPRCAISSRGVERADSWAIDAHKWLNVPYDAASPSSPTRTPSAAR